MTWVSPMTWVFVLVIAVVVALGALVAGGRLRVSFSGPYERRRAPEPVPDVEWSPQMIVPGPAGDGDTITDVPERQPPDPHSGARPWPL